MDGKEMAGLDYVEFGVIAGIVVFMGDVERSKDMI